MTGFLAGCDQSSPKTGSATATSEVGAATAQVDRSSASSQETAAAGEIDPSAVNEQGLVVLQASNTRTSQAGDTSAPQSEDSLVPEVDVLVNAPNSRKSASSGDLERKLPEDSPNAAVAAAAPQQPVGANVATEAERNQEIAADWPQPQAVIFVSGQQHGYIEPCGCTGLDQQKGGLIRRDTLLTQLRDERGWEILPVDVGNQVRRIGRQPELKFQTTVEAMKAMGYSAITLGIDDLQLSSVELVQVASSDPGNPGEFITANIVVWGDDSLFPSHRIIEAGGRRIGITAALGSEFKDQIQSEDIEFLDPIDRLKTVVGELLEKKCDFVVLLAHASLDESAEMGRQVDGVDLVVTAGGYGEPTLHPTAIEGSDAVMVQVGTKGMYGGIVGLFDDETTPIRYQKIAISSQFKDSPRMLEKFAEYQERLKNVGLDGLGVKPISHPTGRKFVGSETCGDCHTTAFEIWEDTPHVHATDSIVAANNDRGGIPRHHDPECISCHATGWNAQEYYPYETGFISPEQTEHLVGSGCENCHGPGKDHVDAEYGDVDVDNDTLLKLRQQMVLRLDQARDKCLQCHDLDNSPDFHVEGAFEEYWEQVKHYGKD